MARRKRRLDRTARGNAEFALSSEQLISACDPRAPIQNLVAIEASGRSAASD